ncbi:hypothetical protein [Actinoplanes flavus]|uniref:Uncharacterized protein n=1 Tax=Actinoplanes flavus TaxID=2820290 RepID=A0ABS3V069_9ACTN|nr:hypothetical protein [Actinoplanes flavus]MBO3744212.1 hypothetical protein [Actinoplanes flavus]
MRLWTTVVSARFRYDGRWVNAALSQQPRGRTLDTERERAAALADAAL